MPLLFLDAVILEDGEQDLRDVFIFIAGRIDVQNVSLAGVASQRDVMLLRPDEGSFVGRVYRIEGADVICGNC